MHGESIFTCRLWTAELLEGEHTVTMVPDGQDPPLACARRGEELRPPAPEERALIILDDLDDPDPVTKVKDIGFSGVDLLDKLVRDPLQSERTRSISSHG